MNRHWIAFCLAGLLWSFAVKGQETGDPGTDSGSSTITPPPPPPETPPAAAGPTPAPGLTPAPGAGAPTENGPAPEAAPLSFTLPGGSGFGPVTLTAGEGRFAQPRYRFTGTLSQGYDDNVFSTPSNPLKQPTSAKVLVQEQRQVATGNFINLGGFFVPEIRTEFVTVERKIKLPKQPQQEIIGSAVTRAGIGFQTQSAMPRTVYTFDANVGALYYYSRPERSTDYNGSIGLNFLHRINARTTVSAQGDLVYASQPNFSRINTPTSQSTGDNVSANAKIDLSYLWSPRVSSVLSYTINGTLFQEKSAATSGGGDTLENGLSTQIRYTISPRTTAIMELRETQRSHANDPAQDSTNTFVLFGADYMPSRRLRATALVGEQTQVRTGGTATNNGGSSGGSTLATPYAETTLGYIFPRGSTVTWTNRYGFEDSGSSLQSQQTYRTNLNLNYVLGARTTAGIGVAYNRVTTSFIDGNSQDDITQEQLQASITLQYILSRTLSFNANYTLTQLTSNQQGADYRRNQIFIGGSYSF